MTAMDNVISAILLILQHHPESTNAATAFPHILPKLPLKYDRAENAVVVSRLCCMVCQNNAHLLGESGSNVREIVRILADTISLDAIPHDQGGTGGGVMKDKHLPKQVVMP
jgi:hypothetical protein